MEELLNKLIEKGWTKKAHHLQGLPNKPFVRYVKDSTHGVEFYYYEWRDNEAKLVKIYSLRDIVSKESGLWQFVCENNLNYSEDDSIYNVWLKHYAEDDHESPYTYASPVWYIIESALCDEDKLEEFLLDNIKIDEKYTEEEQELIDLDYGTGYTKKFVK